MNTPSQDATPDTPADEAQAAAQPDEPAAPKASAARPMGQADCLARLTALFPALFTGPVRPLKLRIQADIQEKAPGVFTKQDLSAFFRRYTGATAYLVAVSKSQQRFDLDGQPAGELTDEHRQVALNELKLRRAAQQTRREQEEAEFRQRAQLLHDYEATRLTEANFCALKGIAPDALPGMLAQARQEAQARPPMRDNRPDHPRRDNSGRPGRHEQRPRR